MQASHSSATSTHLVIAAVRGGALHATALQQRGRSGDVPAAHRNDPRIGRLAQRPCVLVRDVLPSGRSGVL